MENPLLEVVNQMPAVTIVLAGVGLASIAYLTAQITIRVIEFLGQNRRSGITAVCVAIWILGGALMGHEVSNPNVRFPYGAFFGAGLVASGSSGLVLLFYWIRQWVKWSYGERDVL
jgi:hypothetical protein